MIAVDVDSPVDQPTRAARALLLGAGFLLSGYLALALVVAHKHVDSLDHGVRLWVQPLRSAALDGPMALVSRLGDETGLIPMVLLASLLLWRVDRRWALLLPPLMAGTGALQYLTKWLADRPRPNAAPWGFPSGHVLSLAVFFGLLVYFIATMSSRRRRLRVLACLPCVGAFVVVAFSRLYLDMHWLSDVGGGFAIGSAYLLLAIWAGELVRMRPAPALASERVSLS